MIEITKTRRIDAPPDEVFAALTEPDRLRRWHTVAATIELRAGGDYRFMVTPGHIAAGTVEEVVPGKRLSLSWGWEHEDELPPGGSRVVIDLEPDGEGTLLRLHHEALPDTDLGRDHGVGWDHVLDRLVVLGERGDAGWDEWTEGPEVLDRVTAASASWALLQSVLRDPPHGGRDAPTPCRELTTHGLVMHLIGGLAFLAESLGITVTPVEETWPEHMVGAVVDPLLLAMASRGLTGEVEFAGGTKPATYPADIVVLELFVHGWDLARALDRPFEPTPRLIAFADEVVRRIVTDEARDSGRFDAAVAPPSDATQLERTIAFTGRLAR